MSACDQTNASGFGSLRQALTALRKPRAAQVPVSDGLAIVLISSSSTASAGGI